MDSILTETPPTGAHDKTGASHLLKPAEESILTSDELELRAQGHVGELARNFSPLAAISVAFTTTNSWVSVSAIFVTPLFMGGGPALMYGLILASLAATTVTLGLAELASAYPSSGGQYHFAFMLASKKTRNAWAFVTGWLSILAWAFATTSSSVFVAQMITSLASYYHPSYSPDRWQVYLMHVLLMLVAFLILVVFARALPRTEIVFFFVSLVGFVVYTVSVTAVSETKQPASTVWVTWTNQSGWNDGMAFFIGVGQCLYGFLGTDGPTHMAEEIPNPRRNVPLAMLATCIIGAATALPWSIAFMFSIQDLDAVEASALPILEVYYQALHNKGAACFLLVWLLVIYFQATCNCLLFCGRLVWAFARDDGLPYSSYFAKISRDLPVRATAAVVVFQCLYGLIYIASTTAYNSIISMCILGLLVTYAIPQGIVLVRGRHHLPDRKLNLGRFGVVVNAFSVLWVCFYVVVFCQPTFLPVTLDNMNYLSVVLVGCIVLIAGLWWGGKRRTFAGPKVILDGISFDPEDPAVSGEHDRVVSKGALHQATETSDKAY
ncbi:hypothetical protein A1O1_06042 [Capronia coronata CBS 617.96]|uniref:Choline transporter n=1 Tax=Capronia coronata CBS 617.96 TaxID=1182541 RepID=W9Y8V5_9EURO|nr:uncharacterized protein A1O1_06042 [Capronia coronata CBS 617.96]EXJ85676.1 hypothetical protein A1O1_06042 [Capronia coronata CBS 617.96]